MRRSHFFLFFCIGFICLDAYAKDPYSLPWQLRPIVLPSRVVRVESTWGFSENPSSHEQGYTSVQTLLLGYQVRKGWMPLFRIGVSSSHTSPSGSALSNPLLGVIYSTSFGDFKCAPFVGVTLPIGTGGGDHASTASANALKMANHTRSAMDGSLFAVNYTALSGGIGGGYVKHNFTLQAEATLFQWFRTRGAHTPSAADATRTNLTMGVHVGYFLIPQLSVGADWHYQRWLVNASIQDPALKDNMTASVGLRGHINLGHGVVARPGIAYAQAFDSPIQDSRFKMMQIDVPVVF